MADRQPATSIVGPATVQLGTRSLSIDNRPLPQTNPWDANRRSVELKEVDGDCLVLEPKKWAFFRYAPLILAGSAGGIAGLVFMLVEELQGNAGWGLILILVIGLLLVFAFLLLGLCAPGGFKRWVRFDRRAGLLTTSRRPFGFRRPLQVIRSRPLTDLVCVQLLHGGFHSDSVEIGEPGTPGSVVHQSYHSYQLNLVFDDPNEPRYNLTSHSDWKWMREAGQKLADFLGVPVVDQLYHSA